jgi:catalase
MSDERRRQLCSNLAEAMDGVPSYIVERQLGHFHKADPDYAAGVARAMGINFQPK